MSPKVTIVDYGVGNIGSVVNALKSVGVDVTVSNEASELKASDRLVLPGVGSFSEGMQKLRDLDLVDRLTDLVIAEKKPIIGICLGMQLMAKTGFEDGEHAGLGWIDASVVKLTGVQADGNGTSLKVPHVGWNDVMSQRADPVLGPEGATSTFYFVHSYHVVCNEDSQVVGTCTYGENFSAVIRKDNIFATQFHPEKSQKQGLQLLRNFAHGAF